MSGGSLNYLYCQEPEKIMVSTEDLEIVEQTLRDFGADDIAMDTRRLIEYCKSAYNRILVLSESLSDIFHAVEWYMCADYGKDSVEKAIEKYRKGE